MVLETEASSQARLNVGGASGPLPHSLEIQARLLATQYSNLAYHGAALDLARTLHEDRKVLGGAVNLSSGNEDPS